MADGPDAVLALVAQAVTDAVAAALAPVLQRVRALEAAQAKDSYNSGRPPSTDVTRAGRGPQGLCQLGGGPVAWALSPPEPSTRA